MSNAIFATAPTVECIECEPVSRLGYATGRNVFNGSELLIAMKCYFDGSEGRDTKGDTWVTLAGFAAPDQSWKPFENAWHRMLRERYPIAPYIHMWQIVHGAKPFEGHEWTTSKLESLVSDATSEITNRGTLRAFSCRINVSARHRAISEGYAVEEPIKICAGLCQAMSLSWRFRTNIEKVWFFFDRGEPFIKPFKKQWLANRTPPGDVSIDPNKRVWDLIENIEELDMQTSPPIQAADMIAWATTRDLADKLGELRDLDQYMRGLVPDDHAIIDEEILRRLYIIRS